MSRALSNYKAHIMRKSVAHVAINCWLMTACCKTIVNKNLYSPKVSRRQLNPEVLLWTTAPSLQDPRRQNARCFHLFGSLHEGGLRLLLYRAELTFGRPCWHPARRPPASSSGRSCLQAAPLSGCCRLSGCSPVSQTSTDLLSPIPILRFSVSILLAVHLFC